jgi:hypothetical protein
MGSTTGIANVSHNSPAISRPAGRAALLPLVFALGLASLALLATIRQNPTTLQTFLVTAAALAAWNVALLIALKPGSRRSGRVLGVEVVLKKQHYLQACVQGSLLAYWG